MRNFIIGLSILFYALSGVISFKAFQIPVKDTPYQRNPDQDNSERLLPKNPTPKLENILGQLAEKQEANRALVEELQATIARLENKLSNKKAQSDVGKFQATITRLEDELSDKNKKVLEDTGTEISEKKTKVLGVLGGRGEFRSGQDVINEDIMNAVKELLPDVLAFPDHLVIIEGHTDNKPVRSPVGKRYRDNMELSFLRAKAVALAFVEYGIPLGRISVIGYGDTRPIASNETSEGRAENRRVVVKLIPDDREP